MRDSLQEIHLKGLGISKGIAIGKLFYFNCFEETIPEFDLLDIEAEIERYRHALMKGREEIRFLKIRCEKDGIIEGAAILESHLAIMHDSMMTTEVEKEIREIGKNAEYAFQRVVNRYKKKFNEIPDAFFRERFKDVQDISRRILGHLKGNERKSLASVPENSIIFAKELSATDITETDHVHAHGFVTLNGAATSHAAIVSQAKKIPLVSRIDFSRLGSHEGAFVIVDGNCGDIFIHPQSETLVRYHELKKLDQLPIRLVTDLRTLEPETLDGYKVLLSANIDSPKEIDLLHRYGASGVGLFRSEHTFLSNVSFPSEEEQFLVYRDVVKQMKGLPIVMRTFDLGGDKYLFSQEVPYENNPFLGCRAIRFLLREKHLFKIQLKAMLRASVFGNASVMFPMISGLSELQEAKEVLKEAQEELELVESIVIKSIRVGCMIEIPSAAVIADLLAKECDFFSIGTNDLVQYSLAVDRGNPTLSALYSPAHPSVIRLIKQIIDQADCQGIPVSICGEVAADPKFTPLLLGLGVDEFSVAVQHIPGIKSAIRSTTMARSRELAEKVLALSDSQSIQALLEKQHQENSSEILPFN